MPSQSVFLIGPGFIGQEIIQNLLKNGYDITTLVRRESATMLFENIGVKTIIGTLDDRDIIEQQVALHDITFHSATSDHLASVEAVIKGVELRTSRGQETIYIHTSGASLVSDSSAGNYFSSKIFDDEKPEDLDALPDSAHHRIVDLAIIRAAKTLGKRAKFAIMVPPVIYGVGSLNKRLSIQYPTMVRFALKHGYAGHVGQGLSKWSQIHVKDLARGYLGILGWLQGVSPDEANAHHYWFCENGQEMSWIEVSAAIGLALYEAGRVPSPSARSIPRSEYSDMFGVEATDLVAGSNSRIRASRLRKLGWEAQEKGTLESLKKDEIPLLLEEECDFHGYVVAGI